MTLGKGLESLIPPKNPFDSNQPQDNLEDSPQLENEEGKEGVKQLQSLGADTPRTEHPAGLIPQEEIEKSFLSETSAGERARFDPAVRGREQAEDKQAPRRGAQRVEGEKIFQLETDKIKPNPHQPRRDFDEASLKELADSIREFGIIQPLVVTKIEKESDRGWEVDYELVAGERRLMAAKMVGLRTVPAIIRQVPQDHEKLELAVTENIQRTNLNPIEFARAIAKLQEEFRLTQREVATRLGKSREVIANTLRLLSLPTDMQEAVANGRISESQARLLLSVDDPASRDKLFQEILSGGLTVREVSSRVRQWKGKPTAEDTSIDPELLALKDQLEAALGAPVELKREGEGGKITINFYSKEELEGILEKLKPPH